MSPEIDGYTLPPLIVGLIAGGVAVGFWFERKIVSINLNWSTLVDKLNAQIGQQHRDLESCKNAVIPYGRGETTEDQFFAGLDPLMQQWEKEDAVAGYDRVSKVLQRLR